MNLWYFCNLYIITNKMCSQYNELLVTNLMITRVVHTLQNYEFSYHMYFFPLGIFLSPNLYSDYLNISPLYFRHNQPGTIIELYSQHFPQLCQELGFFNFCTSSTQVLQYFGENYFPCLSFLITAIRSIAYFYSRTYKLLHSRVFQTRQCIPTSTVFAKQIICTVT